MVELNPGTRSEVVYMGLSPVCQVMSSKTEGRHLELLVLCSTYYVHLP